jgi:hypothetical protein
MYIYLSIWIALALVVLGLAIYHYMLAGHEDETLHLSTGGGQVVVQQQKLYHQIGKTEFWGKLLTFVVVLYGIVLAAVYFYNVWLTSNQVPWK